MGNNHNKNYKKNNNKNNNSLSMGDSLFYSMYNENEKVYNALRVGTKNSLNPYYQYLNEAIKAEEKKGEYEIKWKKYDELAIEIFAKEQKLKIDKINPQLKIYFDDDFTINDIKEDSDIKKEMNKISYEETDESFRVNKGDIVEINDRYLIIKHEEMPFNNEIVEFNKKEVEYEVTGLTIDENSIITNKSGKNRYKIKNIEDLEDGWNITLDTSEKLNDLYINQQLIVMDAYRRVYRIEPQKLFDGDKELEFDKQNDYVVEKYPKEKILKDEMNNEYIWRKKKNKDNGKGWGVWIQLIDDDNDESEKAISEYFFEDGAMGVYQGKDKWNGKIKILKAIAKDKMLKLEKLPEEKDSPIKLSVNIHNLNQQRRSVQELNKMPVMEYHENLIKLFESLDLQRRGKLWKGNYKIETIKMEDWYILNDDSYDGTVEQRRFVEKAIATPEFAFLEGPPGSGKTTAILELILQLVKRGKKVMLSASTHVAIDNVLERIEEKDRDNLVVPLRIGDSSRVGEAIKKFQIDEKIDKLTKNGVNKELAKKLILDSANLVCGTTMGIQQHPNIKGRNRDLPIYPEYDYLIIDESSKTTFQEFLVPALFAKKWVLVGDIMQLSPYIEQSHIIHNFNVMFDSDTKKATRLAFETLYNSPNPYVVEINNNQAIIIDKYLDYWFNKKDEKENLFDEKNITYICKNYFETDFIDIIELSELFDKSNLYWILISDLIIFEEGLWDEIKDYIPKNFLKIIKSKEIDKYDFQQAYLHKKRKLPKYDKINRNDDKENNPLEYSRFFNEMLKEKTWAEEIVWRMIRVYELRMLERKNLSYYEKTYELLKPIDMKDIDEKKVDRLYHMTLPSILESLQKGNGEKGKIKTTLTEGFEKSIFKMRHEKLVYQHRMHPDISEFSRDMFYKKDDGVALLNGSNLDRNWNYDRYHNHAVWIDVKKNDRFRDNKNDTEAKKVIEELKLFIEFAKENPKENGESWTVGIITFYRPQEALLRDKLRTLCNKPNSISRFKKDGVEILNYTVDKFQGMEADIIFLSMVRTKSVGFLDNINRLNVAITRAKFQRVIVGNLEFFKTRGSDELKELAKKANIFRGK